MLFQYQGVIITCYYLIITCPPDRVSPPERVRTGCMPLQGYCAVVAAGAFFSFGVLELLLPFSDEDEVFSLLVLVSAAAGSPLALCPLPLPLASATAEE